MTTKLRREYESEDSKPGFTLTQTRISELFRRLAECLDDPARMKIADKNDPQFARLMELISATNIYAWEVLGGVILAGDDWKKRSESPSHKALCCHDTVQRNDTELTKEERAYRRGALQAIQFLIADTDGPMRKIIEWEQKLVAARDSTDIKYLGKYLDTIREEVNGL